MRSRWTPGNPEQAVAAVNDALVSGTRLELVGTGSRRGLGRPVEAEVELDLSGIAGVLSYEPEELILVVAPGTPMAEIRDLLARHRQYLAFEPPDYGPLWGSETGAGTIGGAILSGCNGPRRLVAGGARDHVLGVKGVNGFGESFRAGGRVVKNVTGFDVSKLITGSFGTLCVVTELTLKVLPVPAASSTLIVFGLDDDAAVTLMRRAAGELPARVSAAAHLPGDTIANSIVEALLGSGTSATLFRVDGFGPSVASRAQGLQAAMHGVGKTALLEPTAADAVWEAVGAAQFFAGGDKPVWRISVPPARGAALGMQLAGLPGGRRFYDCAGGVVWTETESAADAHEARVRTALRDVAGDDGQATLMRAPETVRASVAPFQPRSAAVAALEERVRSLFDPDGLFNPGRMYA